MPVYRRFHNHKVGNLICSLPLKQKRDENTTTGIFIAFYRFAKWLISILQTQFFGLHHFAQVVQCIAHTAKGGVDAYVGYVGNFLEAHIAEVAHNQHLFLF